MLTVVTNHSGYAARRSFIELPFEHTRVVKRIDPFKLMDAASYRLLGRTSLIWRNLWSDVGQHRLVHLRNGISLGRSPWISSFEDYLPRWAIGTEKWVAAGMRRMASDRCRALIAQCEAARTRQLYVVDQLAPELRDALSEKLHVLLPPQARLVEQYEDKTVPEDESIRFAFVGHDFFRKGGRELLRVFDRLLSQGAPLHLTIVSKMEYGDYATHTTAADLVEARRLMARHPGRIVHHEKLPYPQVLDLYRSSHVGLLLTWSDTFGYSALEAQASGCPIITTDVNAMPEINSEEVGWVVPVPHHPWKAHAGIGSAEGREAVSAAVEEGLQRAVESILNDPGQLVKKGVRSLEQIAARHDPHVAARWMEERYRQALA